MLAGISRYVRQHHIGLLALFIALGGTAWAIENNSVKSKHIANGQVKEEDLAVPAKFISAGLPSACQPSETQWRDATKIGYNGPVGYYRDPFGIVHLRGTLIRCGDPEPGDHAFVLPPGYRNSKDADGRIFELGFSSDNGGTAAYVFIENGYIDPSDQVTDGQSFSLEGISFRCRPSGEDGCP